MGKTSNLKNMYRDLRYGAVVNCNGCKIFRAESEKKVRGKYVSFLFWEHYGRSANSCTMSSLRFICADIAGSETYDYEIVGWTI